MQLSELNAYEYEKWKDNTVFWDQKVRQIKIKENILKGKIRKFSYGAAVVYSLNEEYVLKLYPAFFSDQFAREIETMENLPYDFVVQTPRIISKGNLEGWNYLIMTQLEGDLLIDIWNDISDEEKRLLSIDLGKTILAFHNLSFQNIHYIDIGWEAFIRKQLEQMVEYHQKAGLDEKLLMQLKEYVDSSIIQFNPKEVLLTGEYTPFNLFMNQVEGNWRLTGVIDFADCFLGDPHYDLLGPILFMFKGNKEWISHFLDAYGIKEGSRTAMFQKKLIVYTLLHRFSDLNAFMADIASSVEKQSLHRLAQTFFPF
ncbi:aminoglycoside phosphotransferase family protein [Heyndrickxia acidicola]|uniref:Aminoglycoside phosphotransferase family protein n=1 Tax=Heyndrickxia acidicola TaxID=209389 RepID=A0ABU6MBH7_9BACI|nr:aminoglycoside phosphotransferase family protein [Heyndrickxia acidicola]MED1201768.1 aminoglycoside phosphotransferase family protein [Heyndrickxia acidicola]